MRIGFGFDAHRFVSERKLILGGVEIPYRLGLLGHSDADVLTHAIIDALLGAAGLSDIGKLFPDRDPKYKDVSSLTLLAEAFRLVQAQGFKVVNIDSVIVCEEPKVGPHVEAMQKKLGEVIGLDPARISIKGKTTEGMGFAGRREGIAASAVALLE
jgi:2-C-methyl-D-erythritol 2,4-cyclodiphosphate synthase